MPCVENLPDIVQWLGSIWVHMNLNQSCQISKEKEALSIEATRAEFVPDRFIANHCHLSSAPLCLWKLEKQLRVAGPSRRIVCPSINSVKLQKYFPWNPNAFSRLDLNLNLNRMMSEFKEKTGKPEGLYIVACSASLAVFFPLAPCTICMNHTTHWT